MEETLASLATSATTRKMDPRKKRIRMKRKRK